MMLRRARRGRCVAGHPAPGARRRRSATRWRGRLADGRRAFTEAEGLQLLADYGVPVIASRVAATQDEAVAAADALGYPVVLKTAAPGIAHKSDVGGVVVGLIDAGAVREAYADLAVAARRRR